MMNKIKGVLSAAFIILLLLLSTIVGFDGIFIRSSAADEAVTLTVEESYSESYSAYSSTNGFSFWSRTVFSGNYGNQLSGFARELYNALVKNYATGGNSGLYSYTFKSPVVFNALVSNGDILKNDGLEQAEYEIKAAMQAAYDAFLYDHPEVFWLKKISTTYGISASADSSGRYIGKIDSIVIVPEEIFLGASLQKSDYEKGIEAALKVINATDSRYDTLKSVHDYICNKAWYSPIDTPRVHSSLPIFHGTGDVVCEGYAKAFKILCDRLSIPCVLVSGYAGEPHMWNYVQMDDNRWYLVDVTWDDQTGKIYDTYFIANANSIGFDKIKISEERTPRSDFSGSGAFSFTYPVLSTEQYRPHVHSFTRKLTEKAYLKSAATYTSPAVYYYACATCSQKGTASYTYGGVLQPLGQPMKVSATQTADAITLTWDAVSDASGYRIFVADGGWVQVVKATSGTKYTLKNLKPGTKYSYAVRAYRIKDGAVEWAPKYTVVKTATQPALIGKVTAKQTAASVTLTWDKVNCGGYRVFRYNPETKKWVVSVASVKTTSVTISGLTENTAYIFAVRPYVNTGTEIIWARTYTKVTTSTMLPAITLKVLSSAKSRATIAWGKAAGATGYQVWYSTSPSGGYKKIANYTNNSTYQYGLTSGTTYYYRARAYKAVGGSYVYGAWSPIVSVKIK